MLYQRVLTGIRSMGLGSHPHTKLFNFPLTALHLQSLTMSSLWNVILRKTLRNTRGLFNVLLFLLSIKVFPFVWHVSCPGQSLRTNYVQYLMTNTDDKIRNFYSFFFRYLFNRRPIPRNVSLFEPTIWTSSRPLGELDIMGPQVQFNLLVGS